jgi:hypothetical protein
MSKHEASEINSGLSLGDESLYSTCVHCNKAITLFGVYDDDRGVVFSKDWAVETYIPSTSTVGTIMVGKFDKDCLPVLV